MVATANSNMTDIILIDNNYEIHFDITIQHDYNESN